MQDQRIIKLADMYNIYILALKDTKHPNSSYRAEKLKKKKLAKIDFHGHKFHLVTDKCREV